MTQAFIQIPKVDIASPKFKADPFAFYATLRAEAPVYRTITQQATHLVDYSL